MLSCKKEGLGWRNLSLSSIQDLMDIMKVDKNLYEIRLKCPNSIQRALYFHVINNRYIITHGFTKKTQKTPKREIIHAKQIRREFEEEYYANNQI